MKISRIERQKKNPRRVNIFLDDEFGFGLHAEILLRSGLRAGDELTSDRIRELERTEEEYLAGQSALRYLRRRLRSEQELRNKLQTAEFSSGIIDQVICRFRESGLIDDRRFAQALFHDLQLRSPLGVRLLRRRLHLKGVPDGLIEDLLADQASDQLQSEAALEVAKKYLRRTGSRHGGLGASERAQKTGKHLEQRGFEWQVISSVLRKLFPSSE